jgi:hypothetical protein
LLAPLGAIPSTVGPAFAASPLPPRLAPPPPPPPPVPVPGQDLAQIDTDTAQFIQGTNGQVNVHAYNAPAGMSTTTGWQKLDPSLTKRLPDGSFAPANLPFGLSVAPTASASSIASLTNEGGVTLGMGLTPLAGPTLSAIPGQQQGSTVVYPAPDPATTRDVAVDATASGFNVRVVLHNAAENPSVTLRVALDSSAYLQQMPSGTIQATRPITSYGDSGTTPIVTLEPEFVIGRAAAVDASVGAVALENASSPSLTLGSSSTGAQGISVAVDSTWLHAPGRTFPVTITIPVLTALSAAHTGIATTVNSCAPANPSTPTDVVVGTVGSCADQGKLYFDLPHLPTGSTVVSATLGLYSPDQSTATGVQVYMNGPLPLPYVAPSVLDQSATVTLPTATTSAGIAEQPATGSNLHTWDVTAIVRQWVQDVHTNGGLALVGSGAPVTFASPLGSGSTNPAVDPVLDITYAPGGSVTPNFSDGNVTTIYGLSGTFSACTTALLHCGTTGGISTYGAELLLGYGYTRIEAQLSCTPGAMPTAPDNNPTDINTMLTSIYNNLDIPIVVLTPNQQCLPTEIPSFWGQQAQAFVNGMTYPKGQLIYFEIGNEPNITPYGTIGGTYAGYGGSELSYADRFAAAAKGIVAGMGASPKYYILTGGMSSPTANTSCSAIHDTNINAADLGILEAESSPNPVSASLLGVAVHPYGYRTNQSNFWKNYQYSWGTYWPYSTYGVCTDISSLINLWTSMFPNMPLMFTEDNWADQPNSYPNTLCATKTQCEGTYLADLFTWLEDTNGYGTAGSSPLRVAWFTGLDIPLKFLGVLTSGTANKYFYLPTCPSTPALQGNPSEWTAFWYLDYGYRCY